MTLNTQSVIFVPCYGTRKWKENERERKVPSKELQLHLELKIQDVEVDEHEGPNNQWSSFTKNIMEILTSSCQH